MRRVSSSFLLLIFISVPGVPAEEPVYFADPQLKAAVEEALWISDPTPTDVLGLTSLDAPGQHIADLTGLDYATNLQTLVLWSNEISDLSPLSGLTNLETLVLNNNQISDTSPLSGLSSLFRLDLHENQICSISGLSGLDHLERLTLRLNEISDISALSGLANLYHVDLLDNEISDISPLASLTSLGHLDLRANPLNEDAYDIYIPLILANNEGIYFAHDPRVSYHLLISSAPGGSVVRPGEGEFMYAEGESVILEAQAKPGFVFVDFAGSCYTTENPVCLTMDRDHEIQANFASVRNTIHVDDDAPADRAPGNAAWSDPQEDGTPEHPFDMIQEAIDVATDGLSVIVHPGIYHENIDFLGKNIRVTGIDPNHANQMSYPVVDGQGRGPVVRFTDGEDPNCMMTGFVITAGQGALAGAVLCSHSSPTIVNCLIVGNRATDPNGAAVYCTASNAVFAHCTIADNDGGERGGGFHVVDCSPVLVNSIVWNNTPTEIVARRQSEPLVLYSDIAAAFPGASNLDTDPLFARPGHWTVLEPNDKGTVWVQGDYHLKSRAGRWNPIAQGWALDAVTSPCIDAGDPLDSPGREPVPNGHIVNMGAYGGTAQASKSDGLEGYPTGITGH